METQLERHIPARSAARTARARAISALGPLTMFGAFVWAILQPYRLTILHPHHQGVWWLLMEPPLFVVVAGAFFSIVVARPLVADLEARDAAR